MLIGQAGLTTSEIDGKPVTEVAYIFDSVVWGNGYATEAAKALVQLAFVGRDNVQLHCTIRPANVSSIKVAERIGFHHVGEYVKHYNGKEMPHLIYTLEKRILYDTDLNWHVLNLPQSQNDGWRYLVPVKLRNIFWLFKYRFLHAIKHKPDLEAYVHHHAERAVKIHPKGFCFAPLNRHKQTFCSSCLNSRLICSMNHNTHLSFCMMRVR